ncbi:PA3496 family putative envelope integrity protein [Aeromonas veronii]|uniref:PA3496 family putative envelope integrity protein n=1 Tax=Aeromonas veronii TaxID=654 RepID=UPI00191D42DC|nr:hypothetical protein [Aeromonas veronii]MBL0492832.1 hypothetical protein [Aeromonas veronii]
MKRLTPAQKAVFLGDLTLQRLYNLTENDRPTPLDIEQNRQRLKTRRAIEDILEELRLQHLDDL